MPRATTLLVLASIIVFELMFSLPAANRDALISGLSFSRATAMEPLRWITSLFVHISASHLFFNMVALFLFGRILEQHIGTKKLLLVYVLSGLAGNLLFAMTSTEPVVGASAAMFGVLGAAMLLTPLKTTKLYILPLPIAILGLTFTAFEAFVVYFQPAEFAQVANVAHIAGLVTGAVLAFHHDLRRSMKGLLILFLSIFLLVFLGPVFTVIGTIGSVVLSVLDLIVGSVLYSAAQVLGMLLWA